MAALGIPAWLRAWARPCVRPRQTAGKRTLTPVRQDSIPGDSEPPQRASPEFRHRGLPEPPASLASTQPDILLEFFMSILARKRGGFCLYGWSFKLFKLSKGSRLRLSFANSFRRSDKKRICIFVSTDDEKNCVENIVLKPSLL